MLTSYDVGEYFVFSTIFDPPIREVTLESYLLLYLDLFQSIYDIIPDTNTKNWIIKQIQTTKNTYENLGKEFFEPARNQIGLIPGSIFWPEGFPHIKVLNVNKPTYKNFNSNNFNELRRARKKVILEIHRLCNKYNPILLIAASTLQMRMAMKPQMPEFVSMFKEVWRGKLPEIQIDKLNKLCQRYAPKQVFKGIMDESYKQVLIGMSDFQRMIKLNLYKHCSSGNGTDEMISMDAFGRLFECLFTIRSLDEMIGVIKDFNLSLYVVEDDKLAIYFPCISERDQLPFQKELQIRYNRFAFQGLSGKAFGEESVPALSHLFERLSETENRLYHLLFFYLDKSEFEFIVFPKELSSHFFADPLDLDNYVVEEWINSPKSPFIKVTWKGDIYYLCTSAILDHKIFQIGWKTHLATNVKLRGSSFENFVSSMLRKYYPKCFVAENKFFWVCKPERKKYEIDRVFVLGKNFFMIECKDLYFIEDTTKIQKLKARKRELIGYAEYLDRKAKLLSNNFNQLRKRFPHTSNCKFIVPIVLTTYPDLIAFHKVPIVTFYEFARFLLLLGNKTITEPIIFKDISNSTLKFISYKISN